MLTVCRLLSLCVLVLASQAHAGFDEAVAAFGQQDYARVLDELAPLLEAGDVRAQYSMGVLYENGFGVAKSPVTAADWYRKARGEQGPGRMPRYSSRVRQRHVEAV